MQINKNPYEMNPQFNFPNTQFPNYNHINPNQNPSPNVIFPQLQPQINSFPHHQQNPPPDLPNSLSSLQTLLQFCQSTLHSLSSLAPSLSLTPTSSLTQCPSNPHHWVPPTSLFHHHLQCPTKLGDELGDIVSTLLYPKTLKSDEELVEQNKFFQPLGDANDEVCFSLDDYVEVESNFFYKDCPGVVCLSDDELSQRRVFSLPRVLSVECANFVGSGDGEGDEGSVGERKDCVKILPSEIWVGEREVERWSDLPNEYSYSVLRVLSSVEVVKEGDLAMWVVVNSPRFGVVVDLPMGKHMVVLVRLCLKAIVREAICSYGLFKRKMDNDGSQLDPKSLSFKCPVFVEGLRWFSLQLSILYGETNAKAFTFAMLKYLLSKTASHASLFPLDMKMDFTSASGLNTCVVGGQESGETVDSEGSCSRDELMLSRAIFVYQIAAAIAALRERSFLEVRIRTLRMPVSLTAYQRVNEHAYLSKKAEEQRQKRPDYRPLIDHDSLPSQRKYNQDNDKTKTREELLAEERDYKRRRMSYRGKKLKRSTKEVMRDIIEEYMEAINQAGGIGYVAKVDEGSHSVPKASPAHDSTNLKSSHMVYRDQQDGYTKPPQYDHKIGNRKYSSPSRYDRAGRELHSHRISEGQNIYTHGRDSRSPSKDGRHGGSRSPSKDKRHGRSRSASKDRRHGRSRSPSKDRRHDRSRSPSKDRRYGRSRSPSKDRKHGRSREHRSQRNEDEHSKSRHSSISSRHHGHKRTSASNTLSGSRDKRKREVPDRYGRVKQDDKSSDLSGQAELNDRYDPSAASDIYDGQFDYSEYTKRHS